MDQIVTFCKSLLAICWIYKSNFFYYFWGNLVPVGAKVYLLQIVGGHKFANNMYMFELNCLIHPTIYVYKSKFSVNMMTQFYYNFLD